MTYKILGFGEASVIQLQLLDYLLMTRQIPRDEMDNIGQWMDGWSSYEPVTVINRLKEMPILPSLSPQLP